MFLQILKKVEGYLKTDIHYFLKGGSWLLSSQVVIIVSTIVLAVAFANLLTIEQYGTYKYILSFVSFFTLTSLGGINAAYARAVSRGCEGDYLLAIKTKTKWACIGAVASLAVGSYYLLKGNEVLGFSFIIIASFLPFSESYNVFQAYLNGKSHYKQLSFSFSVTSLISSVVLIGTLFVTHNVVYIILSYFLVRTLTFFLWSQYIRRTYAFNDLHDQNLITYGKELSIMKGLGVVSGSVYSLGLWHLGGGAAALALYSLAIAPTEQLRGMIKYIETLILPKTAKDSWDIQTIGWFLKKTAPVTFVTTIIVTIYILCAPFLFSILFPKYMDAVFYSQLYALSLIITAMSVIVMTILRAKQYTKALHILTFLNIGTDFLICLPAIYFFGILGLIIGVIVSKVAILAISLLLLYKYPPVGGKSELQK
jgi:O-antigen/teichoic acid export membrane protein